MGEAERLREEAEVYFVRLFNDRTLCLGSPTAQSVRGNGTSLMFLCQREKEYLTEQTHRVLRIGTSEQKERRSDCVNRH
jgi:hypothetical protein